MHKYVFTTAFVVVKTLKQLKFILIREKFIILWFDHGENLT